VDAAGTEGSAALARAKGYAAVVPMTSAPSSALRHDIDWKTLIKALS
jgi:hypothetical protein